MEEGNFSVSEWHIENFGCWNANVHDPGISFITFSLYPRGRSGTDQHMLAHIRCLVGVVHPGDISLICSDGTLINTQQVSLARAQDISFKLRFEDVVSHMKINGNGHEDRLIVRYRSKIQCSLYSAFSVSIHVIDRSLKIHPEVLGSDKEIYSIQIFYTHSSYEIMELKSVRRGNKTELQLEPRTRLQHPISVKSSVSFLSNGETLERNEEKEHVFKDSTPSIIIDSVKAEEVIEKRITILLRLKLMNGQIKHKYSNSSNFNGVIVVPNHNTGFPKEKPSKKVASIHPENALGDLSKELMCLYQDQDFSNFQLKCGHVSFPVHKNILSARSPVFKTMLSTDMREAASGCMEIVDLDPSTLSRFLSFLYTGTAEDLEGDSALKLYYAADKYQVPSLKGECSKFLSDNVSISNICGVLSLADRHQDDRMTSAAHDFILNNFNEVSRSAEWRNFLRSEPLLAAQTLTHFAATDCVRKTQ